MCGKVGSETENETLLCRLREKVQEIVRLSFVPGKMQRKTLRHDLIHVALSSKVGMFWPLVGQAKAHDLCEGLTQVRYLVLWLAGEDFHRIFTSAALRWYTPKLSTASPRARKREKQSALPKTSSVLQFLLSQTQSCLPRNLSFPRCRIAYSLTHLHSPPLSPMRNDLLILENFIDRNR